MIESNGEEITTAPPIFLPASTAIATPEQATTVEPKGRFYYSLELIVKRGIILFFVEVKAKKKRKSILIKIRLIGWIVVDYLTDLFNRNSRDYREVSRQLSEMKSKDKILQQERLRAETSTGTVNEI